MSDDDLAGIAVFLDDLMAELGLSKDRAPDPAASEKLARLAGVLAQWNRKMNLTGHREPREIAEKLIADALALAAQLPGLTSIADLGSGAGFPGLPLAILFPKAQVCLVEARQRRVHFQRAAIRELGLLNVRALEGRAETLEARPSHVITAQAMAAPRTVLDLASRWALPGALLAIPSSERVAEEAVAADGTLWEIRRYRVPTLQGMRALLLHRFS